MILDSVLTVNVVTKVAFYHVRKSLKFGQTDSDACRDKIQRRLYWDLAWVGALGHVISQVTSRRVMEVWVRMTLVVCRLFWSHVISQRIVGDRVWIQRGTWRMRDKTPKHRQRYVWPCVDHDGREQRLHVHPVASKEGRNRIFTAECCSCFYRYW